MSAESDAARERRSRISEKYVYRAMPLQQLADEFGVSVPTIANDLSVLGIPRRSDAMRERRSRVSKMYVEQGLTLQQIADECGATAPTIANDLAALGIPRRRGGAKALYPDPGIRTCACCGGTFTVKPSDAAPRLGAGGQRACFCSHECWGRYRWAQQSISEKLLEQLPPKARQRWMGRRFGGRGAVEGHAGGAPIKATPEQAKQIWELKRAGELSHTAIAVEVFGDRRYRKRVDRIVGRNPLAGGS